MSENPKPPFSQRPFSSWARKPVGFLALGAIAAAFSVAIYGGIQYFYQSQNATGAQTSGVLDNPLAASTEPLPDAGMLRQFSHGFRRVAKHVGPAVVTIKSTRKAERQVPQQMRNDPFYEFFERFGAPHENQQQPQTGLGSGFVIDKRGYVVTNFHVIDGATEIFISLPDQQIDHKAELIGSDPHSDLAVLKLDDVRDLPEPPEWADYDSVEVGDWAIAIGSPFGIGESVTVGIVSAKGNRNSALLMGGGPNGRDPYSGDLLQTDAAINPGNSGGPLCDIEGKVMGVNRAIFTRSGGYMGIGFAIPSRMAKHVVDTIIKEGKVVRGWLGVGIQPVDSAMAKDLGIKNGVTVGEVFEKSPAEKAKLQPGDIILSVNSDPLTSVTQLQAVVSQTKPGEKISLEVISYQKKKKRTVDIKIEAYPESETIAARASGESVGEPDKLGLVVSATRKKNGVVVEMVEDGGLGQRVGFEVGDIITDINRIDVNSVATYKKAVDAAKKRFYVNVERKGRRLFLQFTLP